MKPETVVAVLLAAGVLLLAATGSPRAQESDRPTSQQPPPPEIQALDVSRQFLMQLKGYDADQIETLHLGYDIYLEGDLFVRMKMAARFTFEHRDEIRATLDLTEPQGEGLFSQLMIGLFGRHTREYRQMLRTIETLLVERFFFDGIRFRSRELVEVIKGPKEPGQTAIRVFFDHREGWVKGWQDRTRNNFHRLAYDGQTGPMTAFYNYIFLDPPTTRVRIINALKQEHTEPSAVGWFEDKPKHRVDFLFETQSARMGPNRTAKHPGFEFAGCLDRSNFLDIVYGKCIYYQLAHDAVSNLKLPYAVRLEGIISKNKKRRRERLRAELETRRNTMGRENYDHQLQSIEAEGILAARDVRIYLRQAQVSFR